MKKKHALDLVERWRRELGIRVPWLPAPIERLVVRRIASGLIDGLIDFLKTLNRQTQPR